MCIKINYYGEDNVLGFDLGAFLLPPFLCKKILLNDIFLLNQSFLKNSCYICNIQFGEVGEPSGLTSHFLFKIKGLYLKSFGTVDYTFFILLGIKKKLLSLQYRIVHKFLIGVQITSLDYVLFFFIKGINSLRVVLVYLCLNYPDIALMRQFIDMVSCNASMYLLFNISNIFWIT